ncbi:MAG: DUF4430 domain-containing protein [Clostridium sp.]|nr:DUF4430 domain-containing protein [Clostridium sp.]MCM1399020.1 DUF4430 domain-containing protein [Clostridium sp.]MCM1458879.1 DUF4430 domain-containing protein [Bacteroides sp.]
METKKRKKLYNILMAVIIAAIAVAGIIIVGITRGYIGNKEDSINVKEVYGIAGIDKKGLAYTLDEKTRVTVGDTISTKTRARVKLEKNGDTYIIGENSTAVVNKVSDGQVSITLTSGEMLVFMSGAGGSSELAAEYVTTISDDGIYSVSARTGTTTVYSFAGEATARLDEKSETLPAGSYICVMDKESYTADIDIHSLSSFQLSMLLELTAERRLCFTWDELDALMASRKGENNYGGGDTVSLDGSILSANADTIIQNGSYTGVNLNINSETSSGYGADDNPSEQDEAGKEEDKKGDIPDPPPKDKSTENGGTPTTEERNNGGHTTESTTETPHGTESTTEAQKTEVGTTEKQTTETHTTEATTEKPTTEQTVATTEHTPVETKTKTCTLEIRCDTILNNRGDLVVGKEIYVPSDGVILRTVTVEFKDGETVFDVLKRTCKAYGIQIEYSFTPLYGSYYIEGINYLYEFDCGGQSGWMYKVNGWFPNYGCSSYVLSDKDTIVWCYTCKGLGADVGGGVY